MSSNLALASTAIGIDIGTTYCYVGVYKNNSVEVIANEQGNRATPAVIAFTPKERVVGEAAYNHQHLNQQNTIYHAKALLGFAQFNDAGLQKILADSKFPFSVEAGPAGKPVVNVEYQGKPAKFTAEELVGVLFRTMKQTASQYLGTQIDKAVISVPPHYNDAQKAALLEAAKLAELQVLSLCDEPAAVAMAYKLDEPAPEKSAGVASQHQHVVVVDCGGISTNITVLGVQNGIMEILGFDQDTQLGGEHIDEKLVEHFAAEFKRKNDGLDVTTSARAMTRLRHGCEKAKVVLSAAVTASIELDALYEGVDLFSQVSRSKFESLCTDFMKRIQAALDRALKNASIEKDDVQSLIITGGSGKIPRVKDTIKNYFSHRVKLLTGIQNVDEAVAYGCAIQASLLVTASEEASVSDVSEVKMNALSIGIENASGELQVLIPKHTPLPCLRVINATVNGVAKGGLVKVYEGEVIKSAASNHLLGTIALPELTSADLKLEITMDASSNIEIRVLHSGKTRVNLSLPAGGKKLSDAEIKSALDAGHKEHLELLAANKLLAEQCESLEERGVEIVREINNGVASGVLTAAEQKITNKAVDDITTWLASISVGPIIHAKKEDIERKSKGLELIYASAAKKIEAAKNAPPQAASAPAPAASSSSSAPKPKAAAPAPAPMMDDGGLD